MRTARSRHRAAGSGSGPGPDEHSDAVYAQRGRGARQPGWLSVWPVPGLSVAVLGWLSGRAYQRLPRRSSCRYLRPASRHLRGRPAR